MGTGKPPNKDDLSRVYLASKVVNGQTFLELAWARIPQNSTSASAHVGFEFNQSSTLCPPGSDGLVQRTVGDMLIVYDFEGGSSAPVLTLRRWVASGACEVGSSSPPCWGPAQNLTAGGFAEGKVNTANVTDALSPPALGSATGLSVDRTLATQEFGEAGINLTAAGVIPAGSCAPFGKAFAVSRSSGNSAQAQMKDLVGPANFSLNQCGQIIIKKETIPRGLNQNFNFTSNISGTQLSCTPDATPATFTLNDHAGNDNPAAGGNIENCTNVPAGNYIVTEGADPTGFAFDSLSCTATGTGSSGSQDAAIPKQANITIAGGGVVTCTYKNRQQLGAIEVTKTRKFAADGPGDHPHPGVTFRVRQAGSVIASGVTGSNGKVCFDGLPFGTYTVREVVPAGYSLDPPGNDRSVTVDNNTNCSVSPFVGETVSFRNTPLTDIDVNAAAQDPGATKSDISASTRATSMWATLADSTIRLMPTLTICPRVPTPARWWLIRRGGATKISAREAAIGRLSLARSQRSTAAAAMGPSDASSPHRHAEQPAKHRAGGIGSQVTGASRSASSSSPIASASTVIEVRRSRNPGG